MSAPLAKGFAEPVHDAQRAFRAALDALARPGKIMELGRAVEQLELNPAMAHLLLALADDDSRVWWQPGAAAAAQWLRFHTGAPIAGRPGEAAFAAITDASAMPALESFAQGTPAAPESSTTLLVEVSSLDGGPALQWYGPGIRDTKTVRVGGLPAHFWAQWQANHAAFPQGVDLVFTCGARAIGLPRTTRISRVEGI